LKNTSVCVCVCVCVCAVSGTADDACCEVTYLRAGRQPGNPASLEIRKEDTLLTLSLSFFRSPCGSLTLSLFICLLFSTNRSPQMHVYICYIIMCIISDSLSYLRGSSERLPSLFMTPHYHNYDSDDSPSGCVSVCVCMCVCVCVY